MTLDKFVEKYNGQKVDFDKCYGYQCVDLFRQYCEDVLNVPQPSGVIGAREFYTNYEDKPVEVKFFESLPYKGNIPASGDVVIFDRTNANPYGHIAIVIAADRVCMKILEQNGFTQAGTKIAYRSYDNVLGFLRKRSN